MRIVHIVPGSGGTFYCENCLRDVALVRALRRKGHDVTIVPMYLPLLGEDAAVVEGSPLFFGGISTYLRDKYAWFRTAPAAFRALWDAPWLLALAARRAGSTRASGLGKLTLSMLHGESGTHAAEIDRMAEWLSGSPVDAIHISNVLLIGLARRLRERLHAPVVCALQDEDGWLDGLDAPYDRLCWEAIRERVSDVDAFVSVSDQYREVMTTRLALPLSRSHRVYVGIDAEGYTPAPQPPQPPVIGYLAKMTPSLGLGLLVDAFIQLKAREPLRGLRLRAMGGQTGDDRKFLAKLRRQLGAAGMAGDVEFHEEFDRASRIEFLRSLSVLSVPMPHGEASGLCLLEALAAGVPVVQPRCGAFPEIVAATGGGLLCEPCDAASLAAGLAELLLHPNRARELGAQGRRAILSQFTMERMADEMLQVYAGAQDGQQAAARTVDEKADMKSALRATPLP